MDTQLVHSGSLLMDVPISHGQYQPQNFNHHFSGPIRLDTALQLSKNAPVVQVLSHLGSDRFIDWLQRSPITLVADNPDLTVALGGVGTTLESLVTLYSSLPRQGVAITPRYTPDQTQHETSLLSPAASWVLFDILSNIPPPQRFSAAYRRKVAWKTGTSYGFRDAWAIGVSQRYTVGVWVGRPDGAPNVGQTGASQAAPILFDIFDLLPPEKGIVIQPNNVRLATTCWPSGLLQSQLHPQHCLSAQPAWLIDDQAPPTLRFKESFHTLHQWPIQLKQWALAQGVALNQPQPVKREKVAVIKPSAASQFFPYAGQKLPLEANQDGVKWFLNDAPLMAAELDFDHLKQGSYTLTACKDSCDSIQFLVHK
jgi:penicillin-binding protein 1C